MLDILKGQPSISVTPGSPPTVDTLRDTSANNDEEELEILTGTYLLNSFSNVPTRFIVISL